MTRKACIALTCGLMMLGGAQAQTVSSERSITSTQIGSASAGINPSRIEVFANSAMYVANAQQATVYIVDDRKQLLNQINQAGLPPNPQQAAAIAQQRVKAMGAEFRQRVMASLTVLEKTASYGIERIPAVVFDGQRVVYGVPDVAMALSIVRRGGGQPINARLVPPTDLAADPSGTQRSEQPGILNKGGVR